MTVRVLVVDDEPDVEVLFRQQFRREMREGLYLLDLALSGQFEAKVTTSSDAIMAVEGTWHFTGGTGSLSKLSGGGTFKAHMTSPTDSEMMWSGSYEA